MGWMRTVLREVLGLFVDDGSFALAILLWLGLVWLAATHVRLGVPGGMILAAGLLLILLENLVRSSRNRKR